jgi:hypothetical protein
MGGLVYGLIYQLTGYNLAVLAHFTHKLLALASAGWTELQPHRLTIKRGALVEVESDPFLPGKRMEGHGG